ncbi:DUF5343 domain-containing protein [Pseudomonas sp. Irchel s3a10]|uniref:DUF5343 domain-containing protein n=1 Tax=Pseudomonas sp. Irchel s3a10 TaxID=2009045 RepID=UPI000BA36D8E|nr:DUF5343 domain-containing protein [Pseudomonas sp. Irchel s3a10]
MADEKKKGYPKIPMNNWFLLRDKFKQRTPEKVTPSYIASALGMGERSASANIIPPLRVFGLIDDSGKPTDLAYEWRDDNKYPAVCKAILEAAYPRELLDLFSDLNAPLKDIAAWFARDAKVGESAARAYSATYMMLLEADLTRAKEKTTPPKSSNGAVKTAKTSTRSSNAVGKPATSVPSAKIQDFAEVAGVNDRREARSFSPKLHVDIQIHISPDSSPEQIDKIFESMAKHLPLMG